MDTSSPQGQAEFELSLSNATMDESSPIGSILISRKTRIINSPSFGSGVATGSDEYTHARRQLISTPVAASTTAAKRLRRDDLRVNPFEKHLLEQLHKSVWSPSLIRADVETPPLKSWTVDQLSLLNPSKIEESPSTHQNEEVLTPQTEAKAQHAISKFFSHDVVPSPKVFPLRQSYTNSEEKQRVENVQFRTETEGQGNCAKGVNTELSFPPILTPDVEQLLFSLSNSNPMFETESSMNTSLRRRKLDFTFDSSGSEDNMDTNVTAALTAGNVMHTPGSKNGEADMISPRRFRAGMQMESPAISPLAHN